MLRRHNNSNSSSSTVRDNEDDLPVLSREFWQRHDSLSQTASEIESAQVTLQEAIQQHEELTTQLEELQSQLRHNREFAKEQIDRIELVSNHWFYGSTALQPQLWIRGGCPGKMYRARQKLEQCDTEYVPLLQRIEHLQTRELASLEQAVQDSQDQVTASRTAMALCESLQERAIAEHPSPQLIDLEFEVASMQETLKVGQEHIQHFVEASQLYDQARKQYQQAQDKFQESQGHRDHYIQLLQTKHDEDQLPVMHPPPLQYPNDNKNYNWCQLVDHNSNSNNNRDNNKVVITGISDDFISTQQGGTTKIVTIHKDKSSSRAGGRGRTTKIVLRYGGSTTVNSGGRLNYTNIPCPNDCGFITTWHGTYCCETCQRSNLNETNGITSIPRMDVTNTNPIQHNHHSHDSQCERLTVSSQEGAKDLLMTWKQRLEQHDTASQHVLDLCQKTFQQGQTHFKRGNKILQAAIVRIPPTIQIRFRDTPLTDDYILDHTNNESMLQIMTLNSTTTTTATTTNNCLGEEAEPAEEVTSKFAGLKEAILGWFLGGPFLAVIAGFGTAYYTAWKEKFSATRTLLQQNDQIILQTIDRVKEIQTISYEQELVIQQWMEQLEQEIISTSQNLDMVLSNQIPHEQERIWREIRAQVFRGPLYSSSSSPSHSFATEALAPVVPTIAFESSSSDTVTTLPLPSAPPALTTTMRDDDEDDDDFNTSSQYCYRPPAFAPNYRGGTNTSSFEHDSSDMSLLAAQPMSSSSTPSQSQSLWMVNTSPVVSLPMDTMAAEGNSCLSIPMAHAVLINSSE